MLHGNSGKGYSSGGNYDCDERVGSTDVGAGSAGAEQRVNTEPHKKWANKKRLDRKFLRNHSKTKVALFSNVRKTNYAVWKSPENPFVKFVSMEIRHAKSSLLRHSPSQYMNL